MHERYYDVFTIKINTLFLGVDEAAGLHSHIVGEEEWTEMNGGNSTEETYILETEAVVIRFYLC
jgi:hypothetical protein